MKFEKGQIVEFNPPHDRHNDDWCFFDVPYGSCKESGYQRVVPGTLVRLVAVTFPGSCEVELLDGSAWRGLPESYLRLLHPLQILARCCD